MANADMGGFNPNPTTVQGVRIPTYTIVDDGAFNFEYWPKLENAINVILNKEPGQPFNLSYEELFSVAYKCASQQFSEKMFPRLTEIANSHVLTFFSKIMALPPQDYLQRVDVFLNQYSQAVNGLSSIFSYMDRSYVVITCGKNITSILNNQLSEAILSSSRVFDILREVTEDLIEVDPGIIMSLTKGLYLVNPGFPKLNMALFSRFIPNVEPAFRLENLPSTSGQCDNFYSEISRNFDHERVITKRKNEESSDDPTECRKRPAKSR